MIHAHSVEAIRAAEDALLTQLPAGALMQRAAGGLAARCARLLAGPYGARVALLVGSGNNGGDALWAGARLARRGARVDAVLLDPDRVHDEGLAALQAACGRVVPDLHAGERAVRAADLVLDGILGIGGRGGLTKNAAALAAAARVDAGLVVAVDVPSGIDADTGEAPGAHVVADVTVTFGAYKVGLLIDPGAAAAGAVEFVDIGLGPYLGEPAVEALDEHAADLAPRPDRDSDKYRRGVVGIVAGSPEYGGAATLCVGAALRGGAGMVRFVGAGIAADGVRARWPESIVTGTVAETGRVQAWVVGPGVGAGRERDVRAAVESGVPVLIDADGLRWLPSRLDQPALLTPHAGELARLLEVSRDDVEAHRWHHARLAARRWNATVLLKGSTTIVAAPDGRVRVNRTGTPALATAGAGDVLSGLAGSLLAAGLEPLDAGSLAAHLHGLAGRRASEAAGYPTASDILEVLPAVAGEL